MTNENTNDFYLKCATSYVSRLEKYNFVKNVTNDFGTTELILLYKELRSLGFFIRFKYNVEVIQNVEADGYTTYVFKKDPTKEAKNLNGVSFYATENGKWHLHDYEISLYQYFIDNLDSIGIIEDRDTFINQFVEIPLKAKVDFVKKIIPDASFIWNIDSLKELDNIVLVKIERLLPPADQSKKFITNLSNTERETLCNDLINEAKSDKPKYQKCFIGKIDRPTLMYLLGGERPEKIIKIQMSGRHQNIHGLLIGISDHKNKNGGTCLPNFVKKKFCPEILLDKSGNDIKQLNNAID